MAWSLVLNPVERRAVTAMFARMFPPDAETPGAVEIGAVDYLDRALSGAYRDCIETYRRGLGAVDATARLRHGRPFADCAPREQDALLAELERGDLAELRLSQPPFFELLRTHLLEGLFSDPLHGGNRDKLGWKTLAYPGVWLEYSEDEATSDQPANKGGEIRSLADFELDRGSDERLDVPNFDPARGHAEPSRDADVVLVGLGGMGGLVAPILARSGLKVVALEAGPWRTRGDFRPDELGEAFYARAAMSTKFMTEVPRWRRTDGEPTREASFSLGRMVNGVGGSIIHYGTWLRRFHPWHFRARSHVQERWGLNILPEGCTLADWPIGYDELEPYFCRVEKHVGIAGDSDHPFVPRSEPLPMPPLRPFRMGEAFRRAAREMGLHPYPVPVGMNSVPYAGRPATRYSPWSSGFGSFDDDRYHPALSSVPEALATGNLDLRTGCRVVRVLTDSTGHATGVEYLDPKGVARTQRARTVILGCYTFEIVRLLLLSGDERHASGLGNNRGQVGKNFMTKMFSDVHGYCPDTIFNRHAGPAAQSLILDDYVDASFDSPRYGFLGGATLSAENQLLPLALARAAVPPDVPRWGQRFKDHLREWQHFAAVRIQSDALPYACNYLDLDPTHRDRGGVGMPVVRITYELQPNEHRAAAWMEEKSAEILRAMGAKKTWRGPRFTGVISSHDLGGCRMGEDPATSVVDADLQVHDTPGLYVFSGATFPTCPGINPTLTAWAVCCRAADRLVERLRD